MSATPAKKAVAQNPRKDSFAIVPSAIHQRCKDHPNPATSSQPTAPAPLHQQHALQASKILHAHTPAKSSAPVATITAPQTAPRPIVAAKRTSIASGLPKMAALMTPQNKSKYASAKQTAVSRLSYASAHNGNKFATSFSSTTASCSTSSSKVPSTTRAVPNAFSKKVVAAPSSQLKAKPATAASAAFRKLATKDQASKAKVTASTPMSKSSRIPTAPSTASKPSKLSTPAQIVQKSSIAPEPSCQMDVSESSISTVSATVESVQTAAASSKGKFSDTTVQVVLKSVIWNGMVDAIAIKLLERNILRRCIAVIRDFCPRKGDSAEDVMEKYIAGKKYFEEMERTHNKLMSLIANQSKQSMSKPSKPFKTATYYLYRAMFEEYHEQIPEATTFLEKAISTAAEPRACVMSCFKGFCSRIRDLTQQQMIARESLAVGVRRMQNEVGISSQTARDAQALVDLLEEPECEEFEEKLGENHMDVASTMDCDGQAEETENTAEELNELDATDSQHIEEETEWIDASSYMESDKADETHSVESLVPKAKVLPKPASNAPTPSRATASRYTPSKVVALSRTPLGKPQRRVVFEEEEEEVKVEMSTFQLVYEATKPSRRAKQVTESSKVVTPVRRSKRIDQPLRAGQSVNPLELLPSSNWAYQPNEQLFSSGKLVTMSASKSTVRRSGHLVSAESASERLARINEKALSTPSRVGPARRVPVTFNEEVDEDEDEVRQLDMSSALNTEKPEEEISSIISDLKFMDLTAASTASNDKMDVSEPVIEKKKVATSEEKKEESVEMEAVAVEEDAEDASVPFTPARKSTRRAAESAKKVIDGLVKTPAAKKSSRRQSALPTTEEPASTSSEIAASTIASTAESEEDNTLYTAMRRAAFSATSYGSGYILTPKKTGAVAEDVEDTPSRRSRRIANKKY